MKIREFMLCLSGRTDSKETMRAYNDSLIGYDDFLRKQGIREDQATGTTIGEFVSDLKANKGRTRGDELAPATINRTLAAISKYYDWRSAELGKKTKNPVKQFERPKVRNKIPKPVEEGVLTKLTEGIIDLRDRALFLLFLYSGLRLAELAQLDRNSISLRRHQLDDGSVEYYLTGEVVGKGSKPRDFIAGPAAVMAIREYLMRCRPEDNLAPLFLSSRKTRLSCRSIEQVLQKWCRRVGIEHINIHRLRHSFATRNVEAGMSLPVLAKLLGHGSITVTEGYTQISRTRQQREYYAAMEHQRGDLAA